MIMCEFQILKTHVHASFYLALSDNKNKNYYNLTTLPNFSDWELCLHYGPYLYTLSFKAA